MSNDLKPCPFCGGKAEMYRLADGCGVQCANRACGVVAHIVPCDTEEEAVAVWNQRAGAETPRKIADQMETLGKEGFRFGAAAMVEAAQEIRRALGNG